MERLTVFHDRNNVHYLVDLHTCCKCEVDIAISGVVHISPYSKDVYCHKCLKDATIVKSRVDMFVPVLYSKNIKSDFTLSDLSINAPRDCKDITVWDYDKIEARGGKTEDKTRYAKSSMRLVNNDQEFIGKPDMHYLESIDAPINSEDDAFIFLDELSNCAPSIEFDDKKLLGGKQ